MKKAVSLVLLMVFMLTALCGCGSQKAAGPAQTGGGNAPDAPQTAQAGSPAGGGWGALFTYDRANAMQFAVKASIPGEEDAYGYPWGGYDDPADIPAESEAYIGTETEGVPPADKTNGQLQQALEELPPALREAAEAAMKAAKTQPNPAVTQGETELPPDWNNPSNQPALGGRLEFLSGDTTVIIEMSEYCVNTDTAFTVAPVKATVLPEVFFKGGFSLSRGGEAYVTLNDYAVITFLTKDDPGEDVVIKSFGENGGMEYTFAEVTKFSDTYRITGAVEHFSTVGYGAADPGPQMDRKAEGVSQESHETLLQLSKELYEKWKREKEQKSAKKKSIRTIEFDEILYTTSAAGLPLQLHLRAKLVEQPATMNTVTGLEESIFRGKIWLKFYTWGPGGYGDLYMVCNDAAIGDPAAWITSLTHYKSVSAATLQMTTIGGSKAVAEGLGTKGLSGKTYTDVKTDWVFDRATGTIKVTFTSMQGAMDKTFITGRLGEKTQRQANKKLKWFLN